MCQPEHDGSNASTNPKASDSFPWHVGAYDAHCHPTDVMASVDSLASMRTSVLTIMATRSQDQELVAQVAASHGLKNDASLPDTADVRGRVVPAFGWHPWFSHQLYDDTTKEPSYKPINSTAEAALEAKRAHYRAVLQPSPDDRFVDTLPDPTPLSSLIDATRQRLKDHPLALVGEMGLDKAFRLPQPWEESEPDARDEGHTPGSREGRQLSVYRVRMPHQQAVLAAQLKLAGEMGRAVSLHGVQAHGVLYDAASRCWAGHELHIPSRREQRMVAPGAEDFSSSEEEESEEEEVSGDEVEGSLAQKVKAIKLKRKQEKQQVGGKPFPPRICLHSFSGSMSTLDQWTRKNVPSQIYVSFSTAVNMSTEAVRSKVDEVIRAVPDDRVLVESDLHTAGEDMDGLLEDMYRHVCKVKGWELEDGVARIRDNYHKFIFG